MTWGQQLGNLNLWAPHGTLCWGCPRSSQRGHSRVCFPVHHQGLIPSPTNRGFFGSPRLWDASKPWKLLLKPFPQVYLQDGSKTTPTPGAETSQPTRSTTPGTAQVSHGLWPSPLKGLQHQARRWARPRGERCSPWTHRQEQMGPH